MSAREEVQQRLERHLLDHSDYWTAPYGILAGLHEFKNRPGKVRTITFGVARYLDATLTIWSPKRITVRGRGGLAYAVEGTFGSEQEVIDHLSKLYGQEEE